MLLAFELSDSADAKHVTKQRSAISETVIFATLAGDIDAGALELFDEICSDVAAQPPGFSAGEIDAHDARTVAARDEFAHQLSRRFSPERLDMPESRRRRALLVPGANVGEMDVAEGDRADAELASARECALEGLFEVVRMRLELQQRF